MRSSGRSRRGVFPRRGHDHVRCVDDALAEAARLCRSRGARLTPLRTRVLEIVWQSHKPLGAYDMLAVLAAEGRSAAPPTVYRALEFLVEQGLVHRLSSLNAFVGCSRPGHTGSGQFLICQSCGNAAELNDGGVERAITRSAASQGFDVDRHTVEISGVCPDCR
jgi:Fur family zinc uptake transcriptional regulator